MNTGREAIQADIFNQTWTPTSAGVTAHGMVMNSPTGITVPGVPMKNQEK